MQKENKHKSKKPSYISDANNTCNTRRERPTTIALIATITIVMLIATTASNTSTAAAICCSSFSHNAAISPDTNGDTKILLTLRPHYYSLMPQEVADTVADPVPLKTNEKPVQVTFKSITIHNDHDPSFLRGEWELRAYVNGKEVNLGGKATPLWSASSGKTYNFTPTKSVIINFDKSRGMLLINTVGVEVDGCYLNVPPLAEVGVASGLTIATANPGLWTTYMAAISEVVKGINGACTLNKNDEIGKISDSYGAPSFGNGLHSRLSSTGDFTLTYDIKVLS